MRSAKYRISAFSIIELVVVIGIIGMLVAMLLPALSRARQSANAVRCAANLHQIGVGLYSYSVDFRGELPAWSGWHVYPDGSSPDDTPGMGWTEQLTREIGVPPTSDVYNCPSFPLEAPLNYFIAARWPAALGRHNIKLGQVRFASLYVLSGDCTTRQEYCPPFGVSRKLTTDCDKDDALFAQIVFAGEPGGINIHPGGNNVLFADGHVTRFRRFDPTAMTYSGTEMQAWDDVVPAANTP